MQSFAELRKNLKLRSGEKQVSSVQHKKSKMNLTIAKNGNKFALYVDDELAVDNIKNEKEAKKQQDDMLKMLGK